MESQDRNTDILSVSILRGLLYRDQTRDYHFIVDLNFQPAYGFQLSRSPLSSLTPHQSLDGSPQKCEEQTLSSEALPSSSDGPGPFPLQCSGSQFPNTTLHGTPRAGCWNPGKEGDPRPAVHLYLARQHHVLSGDTFLIGSRSKQCEQETPPVKLCDHGHWQPCSLQRGHLRG